MASILLFGGNFAPLSWAYCNGQLLSIAQQTALFALIGTTYGGDGQVTFALPDLRSRVPVGTGQGPGLSNFDLGQVAGTETTTLLGINLPVHAHPDTFQAHVGVSNGSASSDDPDGSLLTTTGSAFYATGTSGGALSGTSVHVTVGVAGSNQPVSIVAPYLALNYIICTEGIFPSRN